MSARDELTLRGPWDLQGSLQVPSSKSLAQRAVALALSSQGPVVLSGVGRLCDDTAAALGVAQAMGKGHTREGEQVVISGTRKVPLYPLECGESALVLRLFAPLVALGKEWTTLTGRQRLFARPHTMVKQAIEGLGGCCTIESQALRLHGPIYGESTLDASVTSQVLSGLLLALPFAAHSSKLKVCGLRSAPYVALTLQLLSQCGLSVQVEGSTYSIPAPQKLQGFSYTLPRDWSGAAFWVVAGALFGPITLHGLQRESPQGDRVIVEILDRAGGAIRWREGALESRPGVLRPFWFDATHTPDLVPPLALLGLFCPGESVITGIGRLRYKESDRATVLVSELSRLGGRIRREGETLVVQESTLHGGVVDAHGDHRMAMTLALAAGRVKGEVLLKGAGSVSKSYPNFFVDLVGLGGEIR